MTSGEQQETDGLKARNELQARLRTGPEAWFYWLFDRVAAALGRSASGKAGTGLRILELAAGTGTLWASNAGRMPEGWRVVLSDVTTAMVRQARKELGGSPGSGKTLATLPMMTADVQAIPSRSGSWDAVLANGVFDFLTPDGRRAAFREANRVLVPGGLLFTVTGGQGHLQELEALVRPFVPDADYGGDPDAFGLENGAAQLSDWFVGVELFTYEDALVFRSAEPLLAYLLSEPRVAARLHYRGRAALAEHVEAELARQGRVLATEKKGVFLGAKA